MTMASQDQLFPLSDEWLGEQWAVHLHSTSLAKNPYFEDLESQTKETEIHNMMK